MDFALHIQNVKTHARATNWSDLHFAAFFNNLSEIQKQIRNGADIDARNDGGETALHMACFNGNSECIEAILKQNPCMNPRENRCQMTPLIMLLRHAGRKSSILKLMLDMGADPNLPQNDGDTPLHIIVGEYGCKREAIRNALVLLKYKVNINAQNEFGNTPLHTAMKSSFMEIIPILLRNGASLNVMDCFFSHPFLFDFHRTNYSEEPLYQVGKYIITQISIGKIKNNELLDEFCMFIDLKLFKDECDKELLELKRCITDECYVTYFDLLVSPRDMVAKYLRNKDILDSVMSIVEKKIIFASELSRIIQDASRRNEVIEIGYKFFETVSPIILPELCLDLIFKNLYNHDLRQLKYII